MTKAIRHHAVRVSCDSLVALQGATLDGSVLFAKNSDRPADECQALLQVPRQHHRGAAALRCTYIEIPQVSETAALIGSRPYWCWGFEHGLNEHGVVIGNHTVFSKDPLDGLGLIGMDLVRLGLERGASAAQAIEVITALVERWGQGGSGYADKQWPYHNSFLVADRTEAYVLETSNRRWAVRRVRDVGSVSNHLSIADDWDALADGTIEHAIAEGWWPEDADRRFDFAAAYRDSSLVPEVVSSGRHRRTCTLLELARGTLSVGTLRQALRDHYGRREPPTDRGPAEAEYFSVCMHAEPVGTTTASLIARIPSPADAPLTYWASFGSPCVGAFVPLFLDTDLPVSMREGGATATPGSVWWESKRLLTLVEEDWCARLPAVREILDDFETEVDAQLAGLLHASRVERNAFVAATTAALRGRLRELTTRLA
jgi:secernin